MSAAVCNEDDGQSDCRGGCNWFLHFPPVRAGLDQRRRVYAETDQQHGNRNSGGHCFDILAGMPGFFLAGVLLMCNLLL